MVDKKGDLNEKCRFGEARKYLSKTANELLEMTFVDYVGGQATSPQLLDTYARYPHIVFIGNKNKTDQTADKAVGVILAHRVGFFGTPDIIITDNGSGVTVAKGRNFLAIVISLYIR